MGNRGCVFVHQREEGKGSEVKRKKIRVMYGRKKKHILLYFLLLHY